MVIVILPWPPSINRYWRRKGDRYFISTEGQIFRRHVGLICLQHRFKFDVADRLSIKIDAYPPDRRKRDIDNLLKSLLDALQHAGVYQDDNQIDEIHIIRKTPLLGEVSIELIKMESQNLEMLPHS